jgi:hypothetical protein
MTKFLPPTAKKAAYHTCGKTNQDIRSKTVSRIETHRDCGQAVLSDKIEKLDHEWDVERCLETNAAAIVLLGSIIGYRKRRNRWFLLTGTVGFFLLQHALQGWCPPLSIIRGRGIRTAEEIFQEKTVYKLIRGDFSHNTKQTDILLGMTEK